MSKPEAVQLALMTQARARLGSINGPGSLGFGGFVDPCLFQRRKLQHSFDAYGLAQAISTQQLTEPHVMDDPKHPVWIPIGLAAFALHVGVPLYGLATALGL